MPALVWNETDILTYLGVLPTVEEYGISYLYRVQRCGLYLDLIMYPNDSDIYLSLFREGVEAPVLDMKLIECNGVRYINDQRGEYLEFAPARTFGSRYDGMSLIPYGVRSAVNPCISITLF
jgi:hypothetical protein